MIRKTVKITDLIPNSSNPRTIKDKNFADLVKSIKAFPEMLEAREIVVNTDLMILGGNMRYKAAGEAGVLEVPIKIVDWPIDKQREFIIKDNISGGEWDWDTLANEWDSDELEEWGLDIPVSKDNEYSRKVETPIYEPKSDFAPNLKELVDTTKSDDFRVKLAELKLKDSNLAEFLEIASYRFNSFDYGKIAEYYSHADKQTKELFEDLALVIIDYDKAIENGFVKLVDSVMAEWSDENEV